jgi:hypothetical protein
MASSLLNLNSSHMALFGKEKAPAKKTTKAAAEKETTAIATVSKETEPVAQVFGGRAALVVFFAGAFSFPNNAI